MISELLKNMTETSLVPVSRVWWDIVNREESDVETPIVSVPEVISVPITSDDKTDTSVYVKLSLSELKKLIDMENIPTFERKLQKV